MSSTAAHAPDVATDSLESFLLMVWAIACPPRQQSVSQDLPLSASYEHLDQSTDERPIPKIEICTSGVTHSEILLHLEATILSLLSWIQLPGMRKRVDPEVFSDQFLKVFSHLRWGSQAKMGDSSLICSTVRQPIT